LAPHQDSQGERGGRHGSAKVGVHDVILACHGTLDARFEDESRHYSISAYWGFAGIEEALLFAPLSLTTQTHTHKKDESATRCN
jgi:hypothetical protein